MMPPFLLPFAADFKAEFWAAHDDFMDAPLQKLT